MHPIHTGKLVTNSKDYCQKHMQWGQFHREIFCAFKGSCFVRLYLASFVSLKKTFDLAHFRRTRVFKNWMTVGKTKDLHCCIHLVTNWRKVWACDSVHTSFLTLLCGENSSKGRWQFLIFLHHTDPTIDVLAHSRLEASSHPCPFWKGKNRKLIGFQTDAHSDNANLLKWGKQINQKMAFFEICLQHKSVDTVFLLHKQRKTMQETRQSRTIGALAVDGPEQCCFETQKQTKGHLTSRFLQSFSVSRCAESNQNGPREWSGWANSQQNHLGRLEICFFFFATLRLTANHSFCVHATKDK